MWDITPMPDTTWSHNPSGVQIVSVWVGTILCMMLVAVVGSLLKESDTEDRLNKFGFWVLPVWALWILQDVFGTWYPPPYNPHHLWGLHHLLVSSFWHGQHGNFHLSRSGGDISSTPGHFASYVVGWYLAGGKQDRTKLSHHFQESSPSRDQSQII